MFKQFIMQVKREFWENKTIILVVPSVLTMLAIIALATLMTYSINTNSAMVNKHGQLKASVSSNRATEFKPIINNTQWQFNSQVGDDKSTMTETDAEFFVNTKANQSAEALTQINTVHNKSVRLYNLTVTRNYKVGMQIIFLLLAIQLLASGMSRDRKEGSIYFWHSLPVSETRHVLTKLLVATLILPLVYFSFVVLTTLVSACLIGAVEWLFIADNLQGDFSIVTAFMEMLDDIYIGLLVTVLLMILALPILGWTMLFAAFFNRYILIIMLVPLIVIVLVEKLAFDTVYLMELLIAYRDYVLDIILLMRTELTLSADIYQLLPAIIFGMVLISASIFVRRWKID